MPSHHSACGSCPSRINFFITHQFLMKRDFYKYKTNKILQSKYFFNSSFPSLWTSLGTRRRSLMPSHHWACGSCPPPAPWSWWCSQPAAPPGRSRQSWRTRRRGGTCVWRARQSWLRRVAMIRGIYNNKNNFNWTNSKYDQHLCYHVTQDSVTLVSVPGRQSWLGNQ